MCPNHYRTGAEFERTVRRDLEEAGYEVMRSAGSKTKIDLVAWKPGELIFIQCKRNGTISPAERSDLVRLAAMVDAVPLVAYKALGTPRPRYRQLRSAETRDHVTWSPDVLESPCPPTARDTTARTS